MSSAWWYKGPTVSVEWYQEALNRKDKRIASLEEELRVCAETMARYREDALNYAHLSMFIN